MNEVTADRHGIALVVLYLLGSTVIFGLGGRAGTDVWLAFLVAIAVGFPFALMYARIRVLLPGEGLWEGLKSLLGIWPARFVAFNYGFFAWRLSFLVARDFSEFIRTVSLDNTPQVVPVLFSVAVCLWAAKAGIEVLARWSSIFIKVVLVLMFIALILLAKDINFDNFRPVLYHGFIPVVLGALEILEFPLLETVLLLWAFSGFRTKKSPYRIILFGFLIAGAILFIVTGVTLAVIGPDTYRGTYFPVYVAVSRINIAQFLTRLEATVAMVFLIGGFVKVTVCLIVASKALSALLGFSDYRFLVTPLALSIMPGAQWIHKGVIEMNWRATALWQPYEVIIQVIIPTVVWIIAEVKMRKKGPVFRRSGK